jgi:hypothetical protein
MVCTVGAAGSMRANNGLKAFFLPFLSRLSLSGRRNCHRKVGQRRFKVQVEKEGAGTAERVAGKGLQGGLAGKKKEIGKERESGRLLLVFYEATCRPLIIKKERETLLFCMYVCVCFSFCFGC